MALIAGIAGGMKYWKGLGIKNGQYGTVDDDGFVPDSVEVPKVVYLDYVISLPVVIPEKTEFEILKGRVDAIELKTK